MRFVSFVATLSTLLEPMGDEVWRQRTAVDCRAPAQTAGTQPLRDTRLRQGH